MSEFTPMTSAKPYDTVGDVLKYARVYSLDATDSLEGDLLASDKPYLLILLNSAWRRLQNDLADSGVETLVKEIIIPAVPPVFKVDPAINVFLTWDGFAASDNAADLGSAQVQIPALPNDMVLPSCIAERPAGSGSAFTAMTAIDGGLPLVNQSTQQRYWEWRDDKIFMKGATVPVDLWLRYVSYYPDLDIVPETQVPIMRAASALGYLMAAEYASSRGSVLADRLEANAKREIARMTNRTARRKAVVQYRRRAFGR